MRNNPKLEHQVLLAVAGDDGLGEANAEEVKEWLDKHNIQVELSDVKRILRRHKARGHLSSSKIGGKDYFKIGEVPFPAKTTIPRISKAPQLTDKEVDANIEKLATPGKQAGIRNKNKYREFEKITITMKSISRIAGDQSYGGEDFGVFPRDEATKKPIIPAAWIKAWFRDLLYKFGIAESFTQKRLGFEPGTVVWNGNGKLEKRPGQTMKGPKEYETLPPGTEFTFELVYPMTGTPITSFAKLKKVLTTNVPTRGWGANPYYFGGKCKVVSIESLGKLC